MSESAPQISGPNTQAALPQNREQLALANANTQTLTQDANRQSMSALESFNVPQMELSAAPAADDTQRLELMGPQASEPAERDGGNRLKIVIAGLDQNIRDEAVEAANAVLNEKVEVGGFKGFLRKVRYGSLGREYYQNKFRQQAEKKIVESDNLYVHDGVVDDEYKTHTTMRFAHEYDDLIQKDAGEHRTLILDKNPDGSVNEKGYELKQNIFRLIEKYAAGTYATDADFNEAKKEMMTEMVAKGLTQNEDGQNLIGQGLLYADNLLQIAKQVDGALRERKARGEDYNIDNILANTDLVLGEARLGARSEIKRSNVERITEKLSKVPYLNETTVATAVSVAYSIGGWAVKNAAGRAAAVVAPGLAGGAIAGLQENRRIKEERVQHSREMAEGKLKADELTGRRVKLEEARYETKTAEELTSQLGILYNQEGALRIDSKERLIEALGIVAETQARVDLSNQRKIDLISFSEVGAIEGERLNLLLALAKTKVDLRKFVNNQTDDQLAGLGINEKQIAHARITGMDNYDLLMHPTVESTKGVLNMKGAFAETKELLESDIASRDRVFNKLRAKEVSKAALKGAFIGATIGIAMQEVGAAMSSNRQGLFESTDIGAHKETVLQHYFGGDRTATDALPGANTHLVANETTMLQTGQNAKIDFASAGLTAEHTGNSLHIRGQGVNLEHLKLTSDGGISDEAQAQLKQAGFSIEHHLDPVSHTVTVETKSSANEFLKNHFDHTTKVTRDFWYDNGTAGKYEKNELGLYNPERTAKGDIKISIGGMTESGSSHGNNHAHWQELAREGKLKVALSTSEGTTSRVFMVNIDEHGNALIHKNDALAHMFGKGNGEIKFNGHHMEVVEVAGTDDKGVTHIRPLATDVGKGLKEFNDVVTRQETTHASTYTVSFNALHTNTNPDMLVMPTVPIVPRGGLTPPKQAEREATPTPPVIDPAQLAIGSRPAANPVAEGIRQQQEQERLAISDRPNGQNNSPERLAISNRPSSQQPSPEQLAISDKPHAGQQVETRTQPERMQPEADVFVRPATDKRVFTAPADAATLNAAAEAQAKEFLKKTQATEKREQQIKQEAKQEWQGAVEQLLTPTGTSNAFPLPYAIYTSGPNTGRRDRSFSNAAIQVATQAVNMVLQQRGISTDTLTAKTPEAAQEIKRVYQQATRLLHPDVERGITNAQKQLLNEALLFLNVSKSVQTDGRLRFEENAYREEERKRVAREEEEEKQKK